MSWRSTLVLVANLLCVAAACATTSPAPAPAARWTELDGARMLVTTTRAARGRSDEDLPILVVLSWARSTPADALAEVGYLDVDAPARIVAIQGFERDGDGFSWWRRTRPAPARPDHDDELVSLLTDRAARVAALLATVRRTYGSTVPLVVTGLSQGGDLSIALGVHHPASISAALPIASRFPAPMWPPAAAPGVALPPIDAFQGTADPVAPFPSLQRALAALRDRGFPVVLHDYEGGAHDVSPQQRADILACAAIRLRGLRAVPTLVTGASTGAGGAKRSPP